ncbi:hypothetical protein [Bradyrhizobium sp.]|uniref:CC0125/CC1285 family lipoprotein n=1 Tax=Bradyrhizobium sp. TaxID=376 RepID=UPI0025C083CC|nr:hypothetical protein [Bradyrhizobium sp.]
MYRWLLVATAAVTLSACATPYQQFGVLGGLDAKELRPDVYRVSFQGNGFTTKESVQVYWLNRCAELALEKGYAGFEILSDMQFVMHRPREAPVTLPLDMAAASPRSHIPVTDAEAADFAAWRDQTGFAGRPAEPVRMAAVMVFYNAPAVPKPGIEGDVHFLPPPVESAPPKVFNAKSLLAQLDPIIKGEKCGGNVCPHVHEYLFPRGKLR